MMYRSFSLLLKETPGLGFSDLMIWQYPAASAWDRCSSVSYTHLEAGGRYFRVHIRTAAADNQKVYGS